MQQNKPWEPCPRCGSNRVKVTPSGEQKSNLIFYVLMYSMLFAFIIWVMDRFGFVVGLVLLFITAFLAVPLIGVIAASLSALFVRDKGWTAKCDDCEFQWEIKEAEHKSPAPNQAH